MKTKYKIVPSDSCEVVLHPTIKSFGQALLKKGLLPKFLQEDRVVAREFLIGNPILVSRSAEVRWRYEAFASLSSLSLLQHLKEAAEPEFSVALLVQGDVTPAYVKRAFAVNLLECKIFGRQQEKAGFRCLKNASLRELIMGNWPTQGSAEGFNNDLQIDLTQAGMLEGPKPIKAVKTILQQLLDEADAS